MTVAEKTIAYEESLAMPEVKQRYEIIDGEMLMSPAPTSEHQWFRSNILEALRPFVRVRELGVVLPAPVDVVIERDPRRTRQPAILYLSAERSGVKGLAELRAMPVIEQPPDLTIEVLSPGDTRRGMQDKLRDYSAIGVRECWLVSPQAETVEVLRLSRRGAERIHLFGAGDALRSEILPDFSLGIEEIFS